MKLKNDFIIQSVCDIPMAVSQEYGGIIRLNDASRFIFESLCDDTTEAALLDALSPATTHRAKPSHAI